VLSAGIIYCHLNRRGVFRLEGLKAARWHTSGVYRRLLLLAPFVAAAAIAAAGMGAHVGTQAPPTRLRLMETDPVTVRGTGFKPHEQVQVTVEARSRFVRRTTAGPGGGFTMRLPGVDMNTCTGFSITVTGSKGSRAAFKRPPGVCAQE